MHPTASEMKAKFPVQHSTLQYLAKRPDSQKIAKELEQRYVLSLK